MGRKTDERKAASFSGNVKDLKSSLLDLANEIKDDDIDRCHNLALHGAELIPDYSNVMTICNTGGLATSGIGTALGVIQYAHAQGKDLKVHVCGDSAPASRSQVEYLGIKTDQNAFHTHDGQYGSSDHGKSCN